MELKIIGGCIIIICGFLFGNYYAGRLKKRCTTLQSFISAVVRLQNTIAFTAAPVQELYEELSQESGDAGEFFARLCASKWLQKAPEKAWNKTLLECTALLKEDKEILRQMGQLLGGSDCDSQINQLALCRTQLEQQLDNARSVASSNMKLARGLGVFGGIFVVLVLL